MVPEFYSQGNGNFRDVNQNRRCDTFFAPFVGRENIKRFYNLIQLDGYNPLAIEKQTYRLNKEKAQKILKNMDLRETLAESLEKFVTKPFTPGALYQYLQEIGEECEVQSVFTQIIDFAEGMLNASFGEGYWTDHWTYNLDLIMDYLEIYPEQEEELLYEKEYICFKSQAMVKPRHLRYAETEKGLRQYHAIQESNKKANISEPVRDNFGQGAPFKMTLLGKLVLLCATKFATLDPYGMGIEMEGGKPGWYDALNGMPAIFGSSMAETYELCRMLEYTIKVLQKHDRAVELPSELAVLLRELDDVNRNVFVAGQGQILTFWNRINEAKEAYRARIYEGISGKEECLKATEITNILNGFLDTVQVGIRKACKYGEICPTYFTYEVKSYKVLEQGYMPLEFEVQEIPYFLEGPVRYLKLSITQEEKKQLYGRLKKSDLYDKKLGMYKVNASLQHASYELGRAKAFTPGWLENESIWLHMEYKYLLELLRSGLYQEFFEDFHQAAVPFLNPEIYGRSIYENSSFIASSCNPDESVHGKGFVARLSGSTIEFISMWKYMMFGKQIFSMQNGEIVFSPVPVIPRYLIPENKTVCTTLLGKTRVVYHLAQIKDYIPGQYKISAMRFLYKNNSVANVAAATAGEKLAKDVRDGEVSQIDIYIE